MMDYYGILIFFAIIGLVYAVCSVLDYLEKNTFLSDLRNKGKNILMYVLYIIPMIILIRLIFVAVTSPDAEIDKTALLSVVSGFAGLLAVLSAVIIPSRIAENQNKITLFGARRDVAVNVFDLIELIESAGMYKTENADFIQLLNLIKQKNSRTSEILLMNDTKQFNYYLNSMITKLESYFEMTAEQIKTIKEMFETTQSYRKNNFNINENEQMKYLLLVTKYYEVYLEIQEQMKFKNT